jgi:uncharacterized protein (DUF2237 family)
LNDNAANPSCPCQSKAFLGTDTHHYNTTPVSQFSRDDICSYTTGNVKAQLACIVMTKKAAMLAFQFPKEKIS